VSLSMMIGWECGIGAIARGTQPQFLDERLLIAIVIGGGSPVHRDLRRDG
jgi:hypothetical protein